MRYERKGASAYAPYIHEGSRIMVPTRLPRNEHGTIQEEYVKIIADAGFDVIVQIRPYRAHLELARGPEHYTDSDVRTTIALLELADKYGLGHVIIIPSCVLAGESGEEIIWQNGVAQPMARPFSDRLWKDHIGAVALAHARLSSELPAVGFMFDFEMHGEDDQQIVQGYTFDDQTIAEFNVSAGQAVPALAPGERHEWFVGNGLLDDFYAYQAGLYRRQMQELRQQIDEVSPGYQFCVYPGDAMEPFIKITCEELATAQAPVALLPADTYARPVAYLPDSICLDSTRVWCRRARESSKGLRFPHLIFGGIMPGHTGADPVWTAKNAYTVATGVDGYWLFLDQTLPGTTYENYLTFLAAANLAVDSGDSSWLDMVPPTIPDEPCDADEDSRPPADVGLNCFGDPGLVDRPFRIMEGKFSQEILEGYTLDYFKRFKVVLLQNFNVSADQDSPLYKLFQDYVAQGGGLMLTHDTTYFMGSPFPEIVEGHLLKSPDWRHVENANMKLVSGVSHPIVAGLPDALPFKSRFIDYLPLEAGPDGTVLVENDAGQAIYVAGRYGEGRVVFAGSCFWYLMTEGPFDLPEDRLLLKCLEWLTKEI